MALTFGGATSDAVDCGTLGSYNPTAFTVCMWVYPTTLTGGRAFCSKGNAGFRVTVGGITSEIGISWSGTVGLSYATTGAGITTNKWWFIAVVIDTAAGAAGKGLAYLGSLTAAATLQTMTATAEGSGYNSLAALTWQWGNRTGQSQAFQGRVATGVVLDSKLTLGQIRAIQGSFRNGGNYSRKLYTELGYAGTATQPDWSGNGNAGTVTGCAVVDHVPQPVPFSFGTGTAYAVAVAAGSVIPAMAYSYRRRRM